MISHKIKFAILFVVLVPPIAIHAKENDQATLNEIKPKSISPFEIARVINLSKRQWDKKRIELVVDLQSTWKKLRIPEGNFGACSGCEGKIFRQELDGHPGREVIVKLTRSWNDCRYLIFGRAGRSSPRRWKLLGHVDHDFNRYQMASHRVVRALGRSWFVLRGQEGSGSGYYLYGETWFEVSRGGVRPVLNYSVDGHTDPGLGGLKWELKSKPSVSKRPNNIRVIRLAFDVFYTAKGFENQDFTRRFIVRRHANYVWDRSSREFVFDPGHSSISESEMNAVANIESEPSEEEQGVRIGGSTFFSNLKGFVGSGFEMFVRLNVGRLMRIARGKNSQTKDWLREFLKECDNIPEKLALKRALENQLPQASKRR